MESILFGNDNAEYDDLLYDCGVHNTIHLSKSILTGRWGSGKTALILLQNHDLYESIEKIDNNMKLLWIINEEKIDYNVFIRFFTQFEGDNRSVKINLEYLWMADILRVYCRLLFLFSNKYNYKTNKHWKLVFRTAKELSAIKAVWHHLPEALAILSGNAENNHSFSNIQSSLQILFNKKLLIAVKYCLFDISKQAPSLSIAIEPIDSPDSEIEKYPSLAESTVVSLINCFIKYFQPSADNPFNVRIIVPWHRFSLCNITSPQKIVQYVGYVSWSEKDLKEFINRRINWELKRTTKIDLFMEGKDPWKILFPEYIRNGVCNPRIYENSFEYIIRHTHHKARDLQQLVRTIVEKQAYEMNIGVDVILQGQKGKINGELIKDVLREMGPEKAELLYIEGHRRYQNLENYYEKMLGLKIPFTISDLKEKITGTGIAIDRIISELWNSGIIGITAVPRSPSASEKLSNYFQALPLRRTYKNVEGQVIERWNWFVYNWKSEANEILEKLRNVEDIDVGLVLHPITFESLIPRSIDSRCPIGI